MIHAVRPTAAAQAIAPTIAICIAIYIARPITAICINTSTATIFFIISTKIVCHICLYGQVKLTFKIICTAIPATAVCIVRPAAECIPQALPANTTPGTASTESQPRAPEAPHTPPAPLCSLKTPLPALEVCASRKYFLYAANS